jgi:hypothetical protein
LGFLWDFSRLFCVVLEFFKRSLISTSSIGEGVNAGCLLASQHRCPSSEVFTGTTGIVTGSVSGDRAADRSGK